MKYEKLGGMDILKILSCLAVFCLHTYIFSSAHGFQFNESNWFLKTPAWAAVWVFFFLSGLNIGRGFCSGKYKENGHYTIKSIACFYIQRLIKIGIPTCLFSLLTLAIIDTENVVANPIIILKVLTFTYGNAPGSNAIGATWYVSTLMWLYLCAPFMMMLVEKVFEKWRIGGLVALWIVAVAGGLALRLYLQAKGLDWSSRIYVPFYCNLDLYLCGLICASLPLKCKRPPYVNVFAVGLLLALMLGNSRIYYLGETVDVNYIYFYCYAMPSIYVAVLTIYAVVFRDEQTRADGAHRGGCFRIGALLKGFADISFEFYLVHSLVLDAISPYMTAATPLRFHMKLLAVAFVIAAALAWLMHQAFAPFRTSKLGRMKK